MDKLTVKEIAEKYEVTRAGVYYWIDKGLPYSTERVIGVKPRIVIDPKDVDNYLNLGVKEGRKEWQGQEDKE